MKLGDYFNRYLVDKGYSITIRDNSVYIVNYLELVDFSSTRVIVRYDGGTIVLNGKDLVVSKMLEDELFIVGKIKSIEV